VILKFDYQTRIDGDTSIVIASEVVVDSEEEAEDAGAEFCKMMKDFTRGYGEANPDSTS
jgi:hypothetical protein